MKVYEILNKLSSTTSTNDKIKILKENKNNNIFKLVIHSAYEQSIIFNIKSTTFLDSVPPSEENDDEVLLLALNDLKVLVNRSLTGNKAKEYLKEVFSFLTKENQDIIKRIIKKDLKVGINISSIVKVFPNLLYIPKYMGCAPYNEKAARNIFLKCKSKEKYAFSEIKYDGRYMNGIYSKEFGIKPESRNGKISNILKLNKKSIFDKLFKEIYNIYKQDFVLNGELLLKDYPDRQKANGIIASVIKISEKILNGTVKKELDKFEKENGISYETAISKIQYVVWDIIPLDKYYEGFYILPRYLRIEILSGLISKLKEAQKDIIKISEYKKVKSYKDAINHYSECISKKEEGTVLKAYEAPWADGKDKNFQIKIKPIMTSDLIVYDFSYGNTGTKYEKDINVLICGTSDGLLKCRASGLKEKDMKECNKREKENNLIGSIVEIKSNGISTTNNGNSFFYPNFIQFRDDKKEAETLDSIQDNWDMVLGIRNIKENNER